MFPNALYRWPACAVLALASFGLAMPATANNTCAARHIPDNTKVVFDGTLDDALWQSATEYDQFWEYQPVDGKVAPVRTTVRVLYDAKAVYFGIRAYDPHPENIRAPLVRRDNVKTNQDFVAVYLDPIGAGKSAMFVRVNPSGVISDGTYSADTDNADFSPDFEVDAKAARLKDGYSAVIRIPFTELRFTDNAKKSWQFQIMRSYPRDQTYLFMSVPLMQTATNMLELMTPLDDLQAAPPNNSVSVRPQVTLRADRDSIAGQPARQSQHLDAGVDLKWQPNAAWVVDATLKPDFSQIELDVPQLTSNAQFALQLQEKRPFFLESSDILESPSLMNEQGGNGPHALYTRSITQPDWGLRATRRDDNTEATIMAARDTGGSQVLIPHAFTTDEVDQPESDVAFGRARTYLDNLSIGGLFTARNYAGGLGDNAVIGPDVVWRSTEGDRVRGQWLLSSTSALAGDDGLLHKGTAQGGSDVLVDWIRKTPDWEPSLTYQQVSDQFRDDTGFFGQAGYRQLTAQLVQKNRLGGDWSEIDNYLMYQQSVTTDDGSTVQRLVDPGFTVYGPHNTSINLEYHPAMAQRVKAGGELHRFNQVLMDVQSNPASWFPFLEAKTILGDQVDIENDRVSPGLYTLVDARFRALDRLEIEPRFEQTVLRGPDGDTTLRDTAMQLLAVLHFTGQDSARAILQRETTRRSAALPTDVAPSFYQSDSISLTYAHRWSALKVWYLGATWSQDIQTGSLTTRDAEVFTKFQFEI
ncbi:carbohydrate binding family 9 domain-containing protein [Silvimonas amylolytica]|uniref:Carbohydrate family 9 binding domain-like n=1 Tax=Silvimonas amylolytica TaxID=449663 RepID=A0ABQ2PRG0_9NEIS|nr:carbohydrate binding family 9 domain-containing protein [Silvimonas amylolytica]GGP28189.1 hypothetical protein GCM10010971_40080 [Silvimonas amylolytica]